MRPLMPPALIALLVAEMQIALDCSLAHGTVCTDITGRCRDPDCQHSRAVAHFLTAHFLAAQFTDRDSGGRTSPSRRTDELVDLLCALFNALRLADFPVAPQAASFFEQLLAVL